MFLIPLDDSRRWYRYHHLFRQLLRREMRRNLTPEMIEGLKNKAAQWFEKKDLLDEALQYLVAADNIPAARQLIIRHRYDLTIHEKWYQLNRWINAIPKDQINIDPEMLIINAWLHENRERYHEMHRTIQQIDQLTGMRGENDEYRRPSR